MSEAPYQGFSTRLHKALDLRRFAAGRARTGALAQRYAVSRETARKWLSGAALPELQRMIDMAVDFEVSFEWLATGRGAPVAVKLSPDRNGVYPGASERAPTVGLGEPRAPAYVDEATERMLELFQRLPMERRAALLVLLGDDVPLGKMQVFVRKAESR